MSQGEELKSSEVVGVCGIYRKDQFASGWYSFSENLLRGFAQLRRARASQGRSGFDLVVFEGSQRLRWHDDQLKYRQVPDHWGRIPAEAHVGLSESAGLRAVLFPNSFTPPVVRAQRAVTVIHDLQYRHLPQLWSLKKRLWLRFAHALTLRKCDAVVAISHAVRDDILRQYGDRWASRVHAIWNPISLERFDTDAEQTFTNRRPYVLCAAADRAYKNLPTLIRAFAKLRERLPEYCLVLAGQLRSEYRASQRVSTKTESKTPSAADLVVDLGLSEHVVITGHVADAELGALYRGASVFVLPSLFEGFGMPAVEAMALGTPTLISDLPVLREVTLGKAEYISQPINEYEIADRIADIVSRGDAARPSLEVRQEIKQLFAPETIARQYLNLLLGSTTMSPL